jgi:hypothetical protein
VALAARVGDIVGDEVAVALGTAVPVGAGVDEAGGVAVGNGIVLVGAAMNGVSVGADGVREADAAAERVGLETPAVAVAKPVESSPSLHP